MSAVGQRFDRDEAARLRAEGVSYGELGRRFGVSWQSVQQALSPPAAQADSMVGEVWTNIASDRPYTVLDARDDYVRVTHPPHGKGYWMTVASLHRHYRKETP